MSRTRTPSSSRNAALALVAMAMLLGVLCMVPAALAQDGGGISPPPPDGSCNPATHPGHIRDGVAHAPACAPARVQAAVAYGNKIRRKRYRLGGGHRYPWRLEKRYDCSGTVSWLLHGAKKVSRPKTSGQLAKWREGGRGQWITVRANGGHTYIVVAGMRMDTSGTGGNGPRWTKKNVFTGTNGPYKTRHPAGL